MGQGYRCDACGRFFDGEPALQIGVWGKELSKNNPGWVNFQVDLCSDCEEPTRLHLTSLAKLNDELPASYGGTDE